MVDMTSINRTYNPKWVTYTGDGSGRDGYVVFANGGLNELRDYRGPQRRPGFNNNKSAPRGTYVAPRKDATAFDYVPDGSGRDSYVIFNYGLKANYRSGYNNFQKDLRSGHATPVMDARQAKRLDPWGTDVSSYCNWQSPKARHQNRQIFNEQRSSIERLSQSPMGKSRTRAHSPDSEAQRSHSITKPRGNQTQILKLGDNSGNELFFASRNAQTLQYSNSTKNKKQQQAVHSSRRFSETVQAAVVENQRTLTGRKMSVQPTPREEKAFENALELDEGDDYAPVFRKKMSVPNQSKIHQRAASTLAYSQQPPSIGARQITADPLGKGRAGVRFKKMGNLTTLEKQYPGARMSSLNKTLGASAGANNQNLFLKNIFTEQHSTPQKMVNMQELEQLKQANQQLRERIGMKQSGHHKPLVAVENNYTYMQKSITAMDQKPGNKVSITEEVRKGLASTELKMQNQQSEMTKGGTTQHSLQGTARDHRKSIDRPTTHYQSLDQDYGSVMSPNSPDKIGQRAKLVMNMQLASTDAKKLSERRNTTGQNSSVYKRSSSVQQRGQIQINTMMAKTAPQGFFQPGAHETQESPLMRR